MCTPIIIVALVYLKEYSGCVWERVLVLEKMCMSSLLSPKKDILVAGFAEVLLGKEGRMGSCWLGGSSLALILALPLRAVSPGRIQPWSCLACQTQYSLRWPVRFCVPSQASPPEFRCMAFYLLCSATPRRCFYLLCEFTAARSLSAPEQLMNTSAGIRSSCEH